MFPSTISYRLDGLVQYQIIRDVSLVQKTLSSCFVVSFISAFFLLMIPICFSSHTCSFSLQAADFGCLLKLMLLKLTLQLNDPPFNFMIHTAPFELPLSSSHSTHWFLQIVPQLHVIGGFETGTACYINAVFPEDAAKILREVKTHK